MIWTAIIKREDGTYRSKVFHGTNDTKTAWEAIQLMVSTVEKGTLISMIRGNHKPEFR
tara:strand:+ start:601 stop:774 length:174 start_codon:yes stop_codon:yes gene_type:complete